MEPTSPSAPRNRTISVSIKRGIVFSPKILWDTALMTTITSLLRPSEMSTLKTYSFNATKDDYASRFKLVFATGDSEEDSLAFYANDNWIISNEGESLLQVIDVNGRVLCSDEIRGCQSRHISAAPGVYMLRLVKGNDVRVQKIVIR